MPFVDAGPKRWERGTLGTESKICPYSWVAAASAKSLQSCPTLCNPIDSSPGSSVPGSIQARILEWVAISFSNSWKWKVKVKSLIHVQLLATPWTAAYKAPLSMGFSRQEYWSGLPLPSLESERGEGKSWFKTQHKRLKIMASGPIISWQIDGETMETVRDYFLGLQNHCRWWQGPLN